MSIQEQFVKILTDPKISHKLKRESVLLITKYPKDDPWIQVLLARQEVYRDIKLNGYYDADEYWRRQHLETAYESIRFLFE